jgi:iron(III) transport system ATP-binding protein
MNDEPTLLRTELSVEGLHLAYSSAAGENPILKGVSMTLGRSEVVALLGPSGSGKTTLLRAIAGLEQPQRGSIRIGNRVVFDGESKKEVPAEARNLGLVFQSYALWPHKTVFDNVAYGLKLRKVPGADADKRVNEVLAQLGLGQLGERYPSQLSGGQQQRVAIARALVYNPPVILMDEPLSNLDAKLREEARAFLRELIVRLGLSAIMVTHDQSEAMAIADRILLLNNGVIEQEGTPEDMYGSPRTLFAAEFMGSNNRLPARVLETGGGRVRVGINDVSLWATPCGGPPAHECTAMIRVERVTVSAAPVDNALRLPLVACMYLGDRWESLFKSEQDIAHSGIRAYTAERLAPGDYWLHLPPDRLWVF